MYVNRWQKDAQKVLDQVLSLSVRLRAEMLLWLLVLSSPGKCFCALTCAFVFCPPLKTFKTRIKMEDRREI